MPKEFRTKIVSANDLIDGDVVYLDADGAWTRHLRESAVAHSDEAADGLLTQGDQPSKVIGPYLVDVVLDHGGLPMPTHFREKFRELGPSNRPDLGRQAESDRHQDRPSCQGGV
ncbi:MAG: DUF2849 domain-containing protein [Geminicoccaceae bacterium]